jgi:hypothetical protein
MSHVLAMRAHRDDAVVTDGFVAPVASERPTRPNAGELEGGHDRLQDNRTAQEH